jgi:hypothetical protein
MIAKVGATIVLEVPEGTDLEMTATSLDSGLSGALMGFPDAALVEARVDSIEQATQQEIDEHGWEEE